jgi:hypothetical protein
MSTMSLCIETCSFEDCNEPVFDYITVPDHGGNLSGCT